MMIPIRYLIFAFVITLFSCKVSKQTITPVVMADTLSSVQDTLEVQEDTIMQMRLYRGEPTRHFRLQHTKLELSFDWENQYVLGKANLILQPYFYEQSELVLDANNFDIHGIKILKGTDYVAPDYQYDGQKIFIDLGEDYTRDQEIHVEISYTAKPNQQIDSTGLAMDKKGLYFINPDGSIEGKPQQIWTQGETSDNSRWFPTIDAPNQKSTQEIFITVDEKFKTLSNGKLIYSKSNPDNTRTDYWKMDKPHAPYLFMVAVGDFAVIEDEWNGKDVDYYVEPEFAEFAHDIFGNTPEMITYYSELLNYPFPWEKYSQVVVRDFVSGAMENTTASVFMEDLQVNSRELIDYDWDDIISHELMHQWFGDLVTCESWANLPLNESFATYGEYLWKNYKFGQDEGDYYLYEELQSYLNESENKQVDLIRFDYVLEDDMFDNHSYAKGGLILHMLRNYLGDEAFFKSLEYYLKKYAFSKAEVHELRMAFEYISGEDLNWFFNQWFLAAGHPILKVEDAYDKEMRTLTVKVWQEQDLDLFPAYKLPLTLDLWENGDLTQYLVEIDRPYQEFDFENVDEPELVLIDSDYILVGEINHQKSLKQLQFQYRNYESSFRPRYDAFKETMKMELDSIPVDFVSAGLQDSFWAIREEVLESLEKDSSELFTQNEELIKRLATDDENSLVRAAAIVLLEGKVRNKYIDIYKTSLFDSSYSVAGNALYAYLQTNDEGIPEVLDTLSKEPNFNIASSVADYYITQKDTTQYLWFAQRLHNYSGSDLWYFIKMFGMYLIIAPPEQQAQGIIELNNLSLNHHQYFNRLSAFQSLQLLSDVQGVQEYLDVIKSTEKDPRIIDYYK